MTYVEFLDFWHIAMKYLTVGLIAGGILVLFIHWIWSAAISDHKKKYDYLSQYAEKMYFFPIVGLAISVSTFLNTIYPDTVALAVMWFFVRLFVTGAISTLIVYVAHLVLKYTYPKKLNKRLRRLRYLPRVNPKTGHKMRLLSEDEEDVHLDEGMIAEENIFSVDYDVWIDEVSGDVRIEKYPGHLQAYECDRCGFQTLKLNREEITKKATESEDGELIKHYKCTYCKRIKRRTKTIARLSETAESYTLPEKLKFHDEMLEEVKAIEIKISTRGGSTRTYDFENLQHAKDFLEEYKKESVADEL